MRSVSTKFYCELALEVHDVTILVVSVADTSSANMNTKPILNLKKYKSIQITCEMKMEEHFILSYILVT